MLLAASARRSAPRALWRTLTSGSSRKQQQLSITSEMRIGVAANYRVEGSAEEGFTFSRTPVETHLPGRPAPHESFRSQARGFLRATFLPVGYPTAVGRGYMDCVVWQAITNFALSANQVLASTFLLYAVGLGAGAIPTAGALNWVLKDGLGQMGTLVFGKTIAHNFDIHSKSWYFLSMILLQLATLVEIITIMAPQWFLLLGSAANCLKGLAWMANGSTRSVFNLAFARDNNIADITAKGTSQYICASMFGTVAGAALSGVVGQDTRAALVCFMALTGVALTSSYVTVKTIPLPTLNSTRLQLLCECYLGAISRAAAARQEQRALRLQQQLDEPPPTDMDAGMAPARPRLTPSSSGSSSGGAWGGGGGEASWGGHDEGWTDLGDGAGAGAGSSSSSSGSSIGQGKGACPDDSQRSSSPRQLWHQLASSFGRGGSSSSSSTYAYTAFSEAAWRRPLGRSGSGEGGSGAGDASFERLFDEFLDPLVPSPAELASEDPPLPFLMGDQRILNPAIIVGAGLDSLLEGASPELLVVMLTTFKLSRALVVPRGPAIHVLLHEQAGPRDMCQAYLQACLLRQRMREGAQLGAAASLHAACLIDPEGAADEAEWGVWDDPEPPAAKRRTSSSSSSSSSSAWWGGSEGSSDSSFNGSSGGEVSRAQGWSWWGGERGRGDVPNGVAGSRDREEQGGGAGQQQQQQEDEPPGVGLEGSDGSGLWQSQEVRGRGGEVSGATAATESDLGLLRSWMVAGSRWLFGPEPAPPTSPPPCPIDPTPPPSSLTPSTSGTGSSSGPHPPSPTPTLPSKGAPNTHPSSSSSSSSSSSTPSPFAPPLPFLDTDRPAARLPSHPPDPWQPGLRPLSPPSSSSSSSSSSSQQGPGNEDAEWLAQLTRAQLWSPCQPAHAPSPAPPIHGGAQGGTRPGPGPGLSPLPQAALGRGMQLPQAPSQPGLHQRQQQTGLQANHQQQGRGKGAGAGGRGGPFPRSRSVRCAPTLAELRIALQDTLQTAERLTGPFMRSLEASGWRIEKIVVEAEKRRARW